MVEGEVEAEEEVSVVAVEVPEEGKDGEKVGMMLMKQVVSKWMKEKQDVK